MRVLRTFIGGDCGDHLSKQAVGFRVDLENNVASHLAERQRLKPWPAPGKSGM
ncbi:MAG: hypothetical protein P8N76_27510 [Pirellulaceae bacterium]|nr:hypothetical protein [Pirellulaceae bacterium]